MDTILHEPVETTELRRAFEREHCFRQLWGWAYFREHQLGEDMSEVRALLSVAQITDEQVEALLAIRFGNATRPALPMESAEPLPYPRPLPGCLKGDDVGWEKAFLERDALRAEVERLELANSVLEQKERHALAGRDAARAELAAASLPRLAGRR